MFAFVSLLWHGHAQRTQSLQPLARSSLLVRSKPGFCCHTDTSIHLKSKEIQMTSEQYHLMSSISDMIAIRRLDRRPSVRQDETVYKHSLRGPRGTDNGDLVPENVEAILNFDGTRLVLFRLPS